MTVGRLIAILKKCPVNARVVLSRDSDGNEFTTLAEVVKDMVYLEEKGKVKFPELTPALRRAGYTEEDIGRGQTCVVLWPK